MDNIDFVWFLLFTSLFLISTYLIAMIRMFMKYRPLGSQSLYDVMTLDNFGMLQFTSTVFTLSAGISRFESVQSLASESQLFVTLFCCVYHFAYMSICVHGSCLAIIRLICMIRLSFLEETIGESLTRFLLNGISAVAALAVCVVQVVKITSIL